MAVMSMSTQEFGRLEILLRVQSGRLRVADACRLIGLGRRQVLRLLREDGATSLVSKRRGRPSNHRLPGEVRALALTLVRERYRDFGPTLACEKLAQLHGCTISRETLRQWMVADGLWLDRRHRLPSPHQPRRRRECLGELVQIDGSEHAWFEDRGPVCSLLAFIDDATSRIMVLRFVASESAFDYFRATRSYLEGVWQAGRVLQRQAQHLPGEREGGDRRPSCDAIRSCAVGAEHRHHLRQSTSGERQSGTGIRHASGSTGQGTAARGTFNGGSSESMAPPLHR